MQRLFISDLHLDPQRPGSTDLFRRFLANHAATAEALYILGDFLEYWLGDDDDPAGLAPALSDLRECANSGCRVFLMHGNRDFLIGNEFASRHGITLLDDPSLLSIAGIDVLACHGDTLCTDDLPYQEFRRMVRSQTWRQEFLAQPLSQRRDLVQQLRRRSQLETQAKSTQIMDVNPQSVPAALTAHGARHLIHGHTHRPAIHRFTIEDRPASRIVLGDWYDHANFVTVDDAVLRLCDIDQSGQVHPLDAIDLSA